MFSFVMPSCCGHGIMTMTSLTTMVALMSLLCVTTETGALNPSSEYPAASKDNRNTTPSFLDDGIFMDATVVQSEQLKIGILQSPDTPGPDVLDAMLTGLENNNVSFTKESIQNYLQGDRRDIKNALSALEFAQPDTLIGPFSETYAIASEKLRIPYIVTSLTPLGQPESPYLFRVFPDVSDFCKAASDVLKYYSLKRAILFYDSVAGRHILEHLVHQGWLQVTGYHVTPARLSHIKAHLKLARDEYYTAFLTVLTPNTTNLILNEALSISMFSKPNQWFLINMGDREYDLNGYVDSYANLTVIRHMMDYTSNSCALTVDEINLRTSAFHDSIMVSTALHRAGFWRLKASGRLNPSTLVSVVNQVHLEGCTGHLRFTASGHRTESYLQLLALQGYRSGTSGTWRSSGSEVRRRVSPSKTYSLVSRQAAHDLRGQFLRVAAIFEQPFFQKRKDRKNFQQGHLLYEGFCVDILIELHKLLGFEYNITISPKYGSLKPWGWTGMVGMLMNQTADVAVAPFQMSHKRAQVVDFTKPFMTKGTAVLLKRPQISISIFQFLSPLSTEVWIAIFGAFLLVSLVMFTVSRFNSDKQAKSTSNLRESLWYIWGTLLRGSLQGSPHAISSRIVSSAWWFFCLIISSIYTANLAAFLTITIGDIGIKSAADLAMQSKFKYGIVNETQIIDFFSQNTLPYYAKMWAQMSVNSSDSIVQRVEQGFERVQQGGYALIWDSPTIRHFISNDCDLMEIGQPFDLKGYAFATQKGSPFEESLSLGLLRLKDEGILYRLERKWWRPQICPGLTQSAQTKSLDQDTVAGMYVIIGGGVVLSILFCLATYCWQETRPRKKKAPNHGAKSEEPAGNGLSSTFSPSTKLVQESQRGRGDRYGDPGELNTLTNSAGENKHNNSSTQFRSIHDWS